MSKSLNTFNKCANQTGGKPSGGPKSYFKATVKNFKCNDKDASSGTGNLVKITDKYYNANIIIFPSIKSNKLVFKVDMYYKNNGNVITRSATTEINLGEELSKMGWVKPISQDSKDEKATSDEDNPSH